MSVTLFIVLILLVSVNAKVDDVILPPKGSDANQAIAMIFAPGMGIGADAYTPIGEAMQDAFSNAGYNLWFGVPSMPFNISTVGLTSAIERVSQELTTTGLPTEHRTLYVGHSVGGAMLPYIVKDLTKLPAGFQPDGMVLMASFLVREFRSKADFSVGPGQYSFPNCPVLSIGAELDGLARLPRFAEAFYNQISQSADPAVAKKSLPVTMIPGMTHMQFASGAIPRNVEDRDMIPEISYSDAHAAVAADVTAFVTGILDY